MVERWEFEDLACGRKTTERLCNTSQKRKKEKKKHIWTVCLQIVLQGMVPVGVVAKEGGGDMVDCVPVDEVVIIPLVSAVGVVPVQQRWVW